MFVKRVEWYVEILFKALKKDNEKCMTTDAWVRPSTCRLVGIETDEYLSLGKKACWYRNK